MRMSLAQSCKFNIDLDSLHLSGVNTRIVFNTYSIKSVRKFLWFLSNYTGFIFANWTRFYLLFCRFRTEQAIHINLMYSKSVVELDNMVFLLCRLLLNERFCSAQVILHNVRYGIRQELDSIFIYSCLSTYFFCHIVIFIGRHYTLYMYTFVHFITKKSFFFFFVFSACIFTFSF